jgi:hypothetical protein
MEINWTIITYVVVGYLALAGFSRGWWKEAVTTVVLVILIWFLQNPTWAETIINAINQAIATIWSYLPVTIRPAVSTGVSTAFALDELVVAPQIDPTDPQTWIVILALLVGAAILIGRASFGLQPTLLGKVLGALIGGFNGILILSLVREYLDGRALPGQVAATSELTLVGGSSFGPAAPNVSIQATGLPSYTILDSALPWIAIGIGALLLFSIIRSRFRIATSADGRKLETRVPPFYVSPPPPRPRPRSIADLFNQPL